MAQELIPVGEWRSHFSYNNVLDVVVLGSEYYCLSGSGVFVYHSETGNVTLLNSINGLDRSAVTSIGGFANTIVIGHENGIFEMIAEGTIDEETFIFDAKNISTKKSINQINYHDGFLYLSCSFGLVIYNPLKKEVDEVYWKLSNVGNSLEVFESTVVQDKLYLSTGGEVLEGVLSDTVNLLDFSFWKRYKPGVGGAVRHVVSLDNDVYCAVDNEGIYRLDSGVWNMALDIGGSGYIHSMNSSDNSILFCLTDSCFEWSPVLSAKTEIAGGTQLNVVYKKLEGNLFGGDKTNGLMINTQGNAMNVVPNGPGSNFVWQLTNSNAKVLSLSGGYSKFFTGWNNPYGFSVFDKGIWTSYRSSTLPGITDLIDPVGAVYVSPLKAFVVATFENGVFLYDDTGIKKIQNAPFPDNTGVIGIYADNDGIWMVLKNEGILWKYAYSDEWIPYPLALTQTSQPIELLGNKNSIFIRVLNNGSYDLIKVNKADGSKRYLSTAINRNGLPGGVLSMKMDLKGNLWVGTENGIAYFSSYALENNFEAVIPTIGNRPLLKTEEITTIEVDGANRKWIGTTQGAWLVSEQGENVLHHFNIENSPLLSDRINDISIIPTTGEIFFGTSLGLLSYRGDAAINSEPGEKVKVFPNPVTRDFQGVVGITGLFENSAVKITDLAGRLIWQSVSNGGMASWDIRDYSGNKPKTGVYFIFSFRDDGSEYLVGKLAIIE